MADLVEAANNAIAYFNMKAQAQLLGLHAQDDNLRQQLCNAVGAATGEIVTGNLNRIHETKFAIQQANQIVD